MSTQRHDAEVAELTRRIGEQDAALECLWEVLAEMQRATPAHDRQGAPSGDTTEERPSRQMAVEDSGVPPAAPNYYSSSSSSSTSSGGSCPTLESGTS